eukprot:8405706-Lingulodinium_polyedra.AAC.1
MWFAVATTCWIQPDNKKERTPQTHANRKPQTNRAMPNMRWQGRRRLPNTRAWDDRSGRFAE